MTLATAPILWAETRTRTQNLARQTMPPLVTLNRNRWPVGVHLCVWTPGMDLLWSTPYHLNRAGKPESWHLWLGVDWYMDRQVGQVDVRGPDGVDVWEVFKMADGTWRAIPPIQR